MALSDEVQTRYGAQRLISLTRPDEGDQTTIGSAKLSAACTDVEALFKVHAGTTFSVSDARHVAVACEGVVLLLATRLASAGKGDREKWREWLEKDLAELGKATGHKKVVPTTNSQYEPSADRDAATDTVRPAFDRRRWDGIIPNAPEQDGSL